MPVVSIIVLSLLSIITLSACSSSSEEHAETLADSTSAAAAAPLGFPDSVWAEKGIPDPNKHWQSEDFNITYAVLKKEQRSGSGYLPRMTPEAGAKTFARITSFHNLDILEADSLDPQQRLLAGTELIMPYTQIYMLYLNKLERDQSYAPELIEMMASILHLEEEFMMVVREYISTVPVENRESEQFQKGITQIEEGITQTVSGVIGVLRDKDTFTQAQLEKLANTLRNTGSELLANLDKPYRQELELEAARTIREINNPVIENALEHLFPFVHKVADTLSE